MSEPHEVSTPTPSAVGKPAAGRCSRKHVSERGPFQLFENPPMNPPLTADIVKGSDLIREFDISPLADKYGEQTAQDKVVEMLDSLSGGVSMTELSVQDHPNGMSLVHAWFGANLEMYRHSHPRYGDCIYYVVAGELLVGQRRLGPGSGFFLPAGQPYKFSAGPEGVEILEFRADGLGDPADADTKIEERSLEDLQRIVDNSNANRHLWKLPAGFGTSGRGPATS